MTGRNQTAMFLIIWVAHGLIYRWGSTQVSDRTIERTLERLALALRSSVLPRPRAASERADPSTTGVRPDA